MKNKSFRCFSNNEIISLVFSVLLGILYCFAKTINTDSAIIKISLVLGIIISFILTVVFSMKSSKDFLITLLQDYKKNGDIVSGFFAIVYVAIMLLILIFFLIQIVNDQTKELIKMFKDIIISITPMSLSLLGIHYKNNFANTKRENVKIMVRKKRGGKKHGKQVHKESCVRSNRKIGC